MGLHDIIGQEITRNGAISLDKFIGMALNHSKLGYYQHRNAIGKQGDFITAPEMTGLFGIMIAMTIKEFMTQNTINSVNILELGAGRGVLMQDICLFLFRYYPKTAINYYIYDSNQFFIDKQQNIANRYEIKLCHIKNLHEYHEICLADGGSFFLANEFFDALPHRQFQKIQGYWHEAMVDYHNGKFRQFWQKTDENYDFLPLNADFYEYCADFNQIMPQIMTKKSPFNQGLIIDYGYENRAISSLQAIYRHNICGIFDHIGVADYSFHVNFSHLGAVNFTKSRQNFSLSNPATFLRIIGIKSFGAKISQRTKSRDAHYEPRTNGRNF